MICKKCGSSNIKVIDSRSTFSNVVRKRKCLDCGFIFRTKEIMIDRDDYNELYALAMKQAEY